MASAFFCFGSDSNFITITLSHCGRRRGRRVRQDRAGSKTNPVFLIQHRAPLYGKAPVSSSEKNKLKRETAFSAHGIKITIS